MPGAQEAAGVEFIAENGSGEGVLLPTGRSEELRPSGQNVQIATRRW
jgi:hypothetical protein